MPYFSYKTSPFNKSLQTPKVPPVILFNSVVAQTTKTRLHWTSGTQLKRQNNPCGQNLETWTTDGSRKGIKIWNSAPSWDYEQFIKTRQVFTNALHILEEPSSEQWLEHLFHKVAKANKLRISLSTEKTSFFTLFTIFLIQELNGNVWNRILDAQQSVCELRRWMAVSFHGNLSHTKLVNILWANLISEVLFYYSYCT